MSYGFKATRIQLESNLANKLGDTLYLGNRSKPFQFFYSFDSVIFQVLLETAFVTGKFVVL